MSVPRSDFAAAILFGGKVLLIGGQTAPNADTASVEVFDPATNTMSVAAPMSVPRQGESAVLLPNGKVLVAGGKSSPTGPAIASAELYEPGNNTWSPAAAMAQPREHHAAQWLDNGKMLVVGGDGGSGPEPNTNEVYDSATNTWTSIPTQYGDRPNGPTVVLMSDRRVLIWGGVAQVQPGNNLEIYDPKTGQSTLSGSAISWPTTNWSSAGTLMDGSVLIIGGQQSYQPAGALNTTSIYNPSKDVNGGGTAWSAGPPMQTGHCHNTLSPSAVGLVIAGGRCGPSDSIAVVEIFDPNANTWVLATSMHEARGFHVAVPLLDGRVFVAGGTIQGGVFTNTTELYSPTRV